MTDHQNSPRGRPRGLLADESGAVTTELVVMMPLLLTLVLLLAQMAVYFHAHQVAQAAADQALTATRLRGGTAHAGRDAARTVLNHLAPTTLHHTRIHDRATASTVTIRLTAQVTAVVPFTRLHVTATATGPREDITVAP